MTIDEVLEFLKNAKRQNDMAEILQRSDIGNTIIKALEELWQYRGTGFSPEEMFGINFNENQLRLVKMLEEYSTIIGSLGEYRAAMEKQTEKKVMHNEKAHRYFCPACKRKCNYIHAPYCSECGQKLDWSDKE